MGLELFVGDDFFRHGEGLQREGSGKVHVGTVSAGSQTRTTNHNALKSQTILFVYNEKKNTLRIRRMWDPSQRSVSVDYLKNSWSYIQKSPGAKPRSMFHVDSNGDESTGKKPCHQAFSWGGGGIPTSANR